MLPDPSELLKAVPAKEVYQDALQPAVRKLGDSLADTVEAARFLLAPIEYIKAWRSRWNRYLKRIEEKVPESNLIEPAPEVIGPAILGLQFSREDGIQTEMFVNLLARAVDKERVVEAHPAYAQIISQLHPDEAIILYLLKRQSYVLTERANYNVETRLFSLRSEESNDFPISQLSFPQNFRSFVDHLYHLGLAAITQIGNQEILKDANDQQTGVRIRSRIGLMAFGEAFAKACVPDSFDMKAPPNS
ncbi:MAG: DUF4393 domain-containing protein [Nitrospira sp. CR1.2]|nr:DUF4393 domain-containing protein [Nitrospira sp. CR1.2]